MLEAGRGDQLEEADGSSPGFQNACAIPRGLRTVSPGPASSTSSPICTPSAGRHVADLVLARVGVHRGAEKPRLVATMVLSFWLNLYIDHARRTGAEHRLYTMFT